MSSDILFAHHDRGMAGSTISLGNILAHLDRLEFRPRVVLAEDGPAKQYFESLDVIVDIMPAYNFRTCPGPRQNSLSWCLNWRGLLPNPKLHHYLESSKWDLLHINDKSFLAAGLEARKINGPIVWHLRSSYFPTYSKINARTSCKTIRSIANHIIAISEDEIDGFEDFKPIDIIFNSVDFKNADEAISQREKTRCELGIATGEILVGQVSTTISEVRGTWDFLHACGRINANLPQTPLRFMIVANIPERGNFGTNRHYPLDEAWEIARQEKIEHQLTFTGYRPDALKLIAAMDIIIVVNRHGVMGRIPIEAMAVGCPTIAVAGHSGKSTVVIDQETGLVVPANNPDRIAEAVKKIIGDTSLRDRLILHGKAYARQSFDPKNNTRRIEEVYRKLLSRMRE